MSPHSRCYIGPLFKVLPVAKFMLSVNDFDSVIRVSQNGNFIAEKPCDAYKSSVFKDF